MRSAGIYRKKHEKKRVKILTVNLLIERVLERLLILSILIAY